MRLPEGPWCRASRDAWYVRVGGKQVRLARGEANRKAAIEAFHRLTALGLGGLPKVQEITAAYVVRRPLPVAVRRRVRVRRRPYLWDRLLGTLPRLHAGRGGRPRGRDGTDRGRQLAGRRTTSRAKSLPRPRCRANTIQAVARGSRRRASLSRPR